MTPPRLLLVIFLIFSAAAVAMTALEGTPRRLPSVALGSAVLLHAERAGALFALALALATILLHAGRGRLPTQLSTSGLSYEAEETAATTAALAELQQQVERQQAMLDALAVRLDRITPSP